MEKQTFVLTALPNGLDATGRARLSVFIAPRLWSDDPAIEQRLLSDYPDLIDWPDRVAAIGWSARIEGAAPVALDIETDWLKPTLWRALFAADTRVRPFLFEDYRGIAIESFPSWTVHDLLSDLYGRASADPAYGAGRDRPGLGVLAADPDIAAIARPSFPEPDPEWVEPEIAAIPFPDAPPVTEAPEEGPEPPAPDSDPAPGCGCLAWPILLLRWLLALFGFKFKPWAQGGAAPTAPDAPSAQPMATPSFSTEVTAPAPPAPPPPAKSYLPPPLTPAQQVRHAAFEALDAFLRPHPGTEPPLPDAATLAESWDFHQAVAALGDYPVMLRRLGLVFDLVLPAGTVLPATGTIQLVANGPAWAAGTTLAFPRTHFTASGTRFTAAPRPADPEIVDGFLRVDDGARFRIIQNDVPGDATKLRNAATHMLRFADAADRPAGLPGEGGLPALRTTGISLVRNDVVPGLAQQFERSCAINRFLIALDNSPETSPTMGAAAAPPPTDELYAEDLVRGYRIDIFDVKTALWHSLCDRIGRYDFLDAEPAPAVETAGDEGFVQFAATEPRDPAAPKSLRTGETMFTWSGWSLAAPRPGKAILPDDSHADPGNEAVTPFRIETNFLAKPGSLPRLRFGRQYRLRARVADLAGNSVTQPGAPDFADDGPAPTDPFTARRYEPVAPPILMLREAPVEGESLERLVVRTPAIGGMGNLTARHVAPPKTAQLMAELHGKLDGIGLDGSAASHALSARESASVRDDAIQSRPAIDGTPGVIPATPADSDPWIQTAPFVTVGYLPDPQAKGVALTGLPGAAAVDAVESITFDGTWPDLKPFRVELKAIPVGTMPAAPSWQPLVGAGSGVLTVELAPAQRAVVRINSRIDAADLDTSGVWEWTEKQGPANLLTVKADIVAGRHWAHLPWRDLTLVHAVQKPLAPPQITTLDPAKALGESFVRITGSASADNPSSARLQLSASWEDPVDDPAEPGPGLRTSAAEIGEAIVGEDALPVPLLDGTTGAALIHEFHDTRYHRVSYTPRAVTRFREYFPPASNTPDATTLAGPAFDVDVLNSARPAPPAFLYAIPVFEWDTPPGTAGMTERTRQGGGLRIYLDRPWYSSGDGELLGVVFQDNVAFPSPEDPLAKLVTVWGADPIWRGAPTPARATPTSFPQAIETGAGLSLSAHAATVSVAGHEVRFDATRKLWHADIRIDCGDAYWPFVRLALARFQPRSVKDAELSAVHQSAFIQVPPTRHAKIDLAGAVLKIHVDGPTHRASEASDTFLPQATTSNGLNEVEAVIEQCAAGADPSDPLSWTPIETTRMLIVQEPATPGLWEGEMTLPASLPAGVRLALREYEWFRTDDTDLSDDSRTGRRFARRMVYADIFPI